MLLVPAHALSMHAGSDETAAWLRQLRHIAASVNPAACRYADGAHLHEDCEMIRHMVDLMRSGIHVAIVTAAGRAQATGAQALR